MLDNIGLKLLTDKLFLLFIKRLSLLMVDFNWMVLCLFQGLMKKKVPSVELRESVALSVGAVIHTFSAEEKNLQSPVSSQTFLFSWPIIFNLCCDYSCKFQCFNTVNTDGCFILGRIVVIFLVKRKTFLSKGHIVIAWVMTSSNFLCKCGWPEGVTGTFAITVKR